jgi:hypothetical protein
MNKFMQLLDFDYSPDEVLALIQKQSPSIAKKVYKMLVGGLGSSEILSFLSKDKDLPKSLPKNFKPYTPEDIASIKLIQAKNNVPKSRDEQSKNDLLKFTKQAAAFATPFAAAKLAPMAGKAIQSIAPQATQMAQSALQRAAPQLAGPGAVLPNAIPTASTQLQGAALQTNAPMPQQPITSPTQAPIEPKSPSAPILSKQQAAQKLFQLGVIEKVDNMLKNGNPPEAISAVLTAQGNTRGKTDQELIDTIAAYAQGQEEAVSEAPIKESLIPEKKVSTSVPQEKIENVPIEEEVEVEQKPIFTNDIVNTPNGIGEIKAIRNGKAIVEIDGKKFEVDEQDIEPSTFTDEEVADAYDDLMSKIPEKHRSGFISWAGYDENKDELGFIPRGGKYEVIKNPPAELVKLVKEGNGVARTTGENREGLWIAGEDTRGGPISQYLHDMRRKKEAQEEKQLKFDFNLPKPEKKDVGMKPIFDEMSYPRNLSRERERKKKLEEKEKKKKEKDEAKKRKKQA